MGKFDCSMDHQENCLADTFLKAKIPNGMYLLAVEVFWEQDYFKNINLSMHTQLNALTPLKYVSCGSNFDLVFYKAFLSYYLKFFTNKTGKLAKGSSSAFKSKRITIVEDISRKLAEIGCKT